MSLDLFSVGSYEDSEQFDWNERPQRDSSDTEPVVRIPVDPGDYFDRHSIAVWKANRGDSRYRGYFCQVVRTLRDSGLHLWAVMRDYLSWTDRVAYDREGEELLAALDQLHAINGLLWKYEDEIRKLAAEAMAAAEQADIPPVLKNYVALARLIHETNDTRSHVKTKINEHFSTSGDVKHYSTTPVS